MSTSNKLRGVAGAAIPPGDGLTLFWMIGPAASAFSDHPDRVAILLDAAGRSQAFGAVAAALHALGFTITFVNAASFPGAPFSFRHVVAGASTRGTSLGDLRTHLGPVPHLLLGAYDGS